MTPRRPGGHLQGIVYRALRSGGELSARQLAERLGENLESCRKACQYLKERGYVSKIGMTQGVTYVAIKKRRGPQDRRGKSPGSRNMRGARAWAHWLKMMHVKHGADWRPKQCGLLDQAWPMPKA